MKKKYVLSVILVAFLSACTFSTAKQVKNDVVIQKVDKDDIRDIIKKEKLVVNEGAELIFTANGEGIAPLSVVSHAQALTLAKRAAMADAYAQLAGKLYGVKINARDTVRDAVLRDSSIITQVQGLVKNANIISENFKDGLYKVLVELKIDQNKWQEIFSY